MTSSSLLSLLVLAVVAAASPFSLIAFSLVLATARGPRNGVAFIAGWVTTIVLIGVVMSLVGANVEVESSNAAGKWTLALQLAMGVVLVIAWMRRRSRPWEHEAVPKAPPKPEPAWQRRLSTMGYPGAFVVGGMVQTWPVMIAAAAEILRLDLGAGLSLAWMLAFALSTTVGIVVLEVLAWRSPSTAVDRLNLLRNYIARHRDSVVNWLYLIGGLWLFFRGLIGLV